MIYGCETLLLRPVHILIDFMRFIFTCCIALSFIGSAFAQDAMDTTTQRANLHFQTTYIYQYKPVFNAAYSGPHSIVNTEEKQNSLTATLFFGLRLWRGAEIYINPELAGGSGLSGAFGMGASTNGETFRVGDPAPSLYLARSYFKQTISLKSGQYEWIADDGNQLHIKESSRFIRFYAGKFSIGDLLDNNAYANSPREQFLNWALMSNSAWDYAANLRGYTVGAGVMLQWDKMSYKLVMAAEPKTANANELNYDFGMARGLNAEITRAITIHKRPGNVRLLLYHNEANMGTYRTSINDAAGTIAPDITLTRKYGTTKNGFGINYDQVLTSAVGLFARVGWNDGKAETWAFTESDRTLSAGVNLDGKIWHRDPDNIGIGMVGNALSKDHREYLAAGGLGFQLGDGKLNYAPEMVAEIYYNCHPVAAGLWLTADYQFAMNPGYNKDRGPLSVFSFRLHVEL